jgi:chemotaxis protein histidine kinase CheA
MTTNELVQQIEKIEKNLNNPNLPDSAKEKLKERVEKLKADLKEAEKDIEKKEEKLEKEEKKVQSDVQDEIAKLEKNLNNPNLPDSVKEVMRKKIAAAKEKLAEQKQEIKEDKKEAAEEKKELKEAVKEVEKVAKEVEKVAKQEDKEEKPKKAVRKPIKKAKTEIKKPKVKVKERAERSEKRKKEMRKIATELSALIEKNKKLRKKYEGQGVDLDRDAGRSAKPFGYRFKGKKDYRVPTEAQIKRGLKRGTIDYEARPNRSDVYPKGYKGKIKLEEGGMMEDGGMMKKGGMNDGSPNYEGANRKFNDNVLNREWATLLKEYDELTITKDYSPSRSKDKPFILDINDDSYFYESKEDRDFDYETMNKLAKYRKKEDGGMMKKGGDVQGKQTDKAKDGQRFAKPKGWRWKDEAIKKVGKVKMSKSPSKFMRKKYPDLVYWEDRIDKSDKNPSRKYTSN